MSIRMMVSKEEFETDPVNVELSESWSKEAGHPIYIRTSHVGLVISEREANGYHDSDFYATVWNFEKSAPEEILVGSTRGWTYPNGSNIDASPEIMALYNAYQEAKRLKEVARYEAERAKMPVVGKLVTVTKGRKLPVGTVGEVFYFDKDKYKRSNSSFMAICGFYYEPSDYRVGIRLIDGTRVFVSAANVQVKE